MGNREENIRRLLETHRPADIRPEFKRELRLMLETELRRSPAPAFRLFNRWRLAAAVIVVAPLIGIVVWMSERDGRKDIPPSSPLPVEPSRENADLSEETRRLLSNRFQTIEERLAMNAEADRHLERLMLGDELSKGKMASQSSPKADAKSQPLFPQGFEWKYYPTPIEELVDEGPSARSRLKDAVSRKDLDPSEAKALEQFWKAQDREIRDLLQNLGSNDLNARASARVELVRVGTPAISFLREAATSGNLRLSLEAEALLQGTFRAKGYADGVKVVHVLVGQSHQIKRTGEFLFKEGKEMDEVFAQIPDALKGIDFSRYMIAAHLEGPTGHGAPNFSHTFLYRGFMTGDDWIAFVLDARDAAKYKCDGRCVIHRNCLVVLRKIAKPVRFRLSGR